MNTKIYALVLIGLAATVASGCGSASAATPTAVVVANDSAQTILSEGRLEPRTYVDMAFLTSGQIVSVPVAEGAKVKKGQQLVQLDDTQQQQALEKAKLAIEQAQVSVDSAQHNLNSLVGWSPNKSQLAAAQADVANAQAAVDVAQANFDKVAFQPDVSGMPQSLGLQQATNNFDKAQAQLDYLYSTRPDVTAAANSVQAAKLALSSAQLDLQNAQHAVERMALQAPFDGTVTLLNARPGASVSAGQSMATVADLSKWIIKTDDLTELQVVRIKVGQKVSITFDALPDKKFNGTVEYIASQYVESHGDITYTVTITLTDADPSLRWGMTATVEFLE